MRHGDEQMRGGPVRTLDPEPSVPAADSNGIDTPHAGRRVRLLLVGLTIVTIALIVVFLTIDVNGQWDFALPRRLRKVLAMVVIGYAVGASTVVFQTVTENRILTPSIMGFDALYVLIQTVIVFFFGTTTLIVLGDEALFAINVGLMVLFAGGLYRWLFGGRSGRSSHGLYFLVLVGIIFGTMFNSLTSLMQRLIDPNEFQTLQDRLFASVNSVDESLLGISVLVVVAVSLTGLRLLRDLDVLVLGREHAITLGVEHQRIVNRSLVMVTVLVSVSTALVGPITFFGLLVANLARQLIRTPRHVLLIPTASLLGIISLVGGQLLLEQVFDFSTALSVIINFVGGLYFIGLLVQQGRRDATR